VKHYRRICLLLFAMAATWTLAQEQSGTAAEPPAEQTPAGSGEATPEPAPDPDQAATGDETSPFDYRASEQISEDLSVSFPVDI
jgi:hypothetical protein